VERQSRSRHRWPGRAGLRSRVPALCALACLALGVRSPVADCSSPVSQSDRHPRPVAVFGVDAGDWLVIDRLIASGRLPAFARLKEAASLGTLEAPPPLLSPIIWTTMATGREPEDHGVLEFMTDLPGGGQAPVSGGARRAAALWEIWSRAGRGVAVTGWWATWPADEVRGVVVSDRISSPHLKEAAPPDAGLVFPAARQRELLGLAVPPEAIGFEVLSRFLPLTRAEFERGLAAERQSASRLYRDPVAHVRAALAAARTWRAISTRLAAERPALWMVYYELVDTVSHLFVRDKARGTAAIASAYEEMDGALADAARALDPRTLVVVLSDHGFQPPDAGIREDPADLTAGATAWHRPRGIVAVTTAARLRPVEGNRPDGDRATPEDWPRSPLGALSPLDLAPSLLVCTGLPVARDMPGRVVPALACGQKETLPRIASYGGHDLPKTAAGPAPGARAEMERLRALGYVTGPSSTSLARVNLGEILYRKGDFRGAERELASVLRADPSSERATLWLARTCVALGRPEDALRLYDRLIQAARSTGSARLDPIVFLAATDLDLARNRAPAAAARLARVPAALEQAPDVLTARGALAEAQDGPDEAEQLYRRALARAPSDIEPLRRLVDLLLARGRVAAAAAIAGPAAQSYPESPPHLSIDGEVALAGRRYREAERLFESALALAPGSVSVSVELARARLLDGRPDAALAALRDVTQSREAEMVRGSALSQNGDWAGAAAAFERASAGATPAPALLTALGTAQLRAGRAGDAVKTLERSLQLKPDQPDIRHLLDEARRRSGGD
jgi:tetratricopeptide (TPR) repeat protein